MTYEAFESEDGAPAGSADRRGNGGGGGVVARIGGSLRMSAKRHVHAEDGYSVPAAASTPLWSSSNGGGAAMDHRRAGLRFSVLVVLGLVCIAMSLTAVLLVRDRNDVDGASALAPRVIAGRLLPGANVIDGLMNVVRRRHLRAAWVSTAVGSLTQYDIRFANQNYTNVSVGHFEVVSLVGTLTSINKTAANGDAQQDGPGGAWHLHIAVGDGFGRTVSGHLAANAIVYTTLEYTMLYDCSVEFYRADDGTSGYDELQIRNVTWC